MRDWLVDIVGEDLATGALLVIVTLAIVLAFVVLLMIFRGFSGTKVRSGKRARHARLAVMDAAVVDSRRRLVLVRRDDVEHLVMIGGPSDIVIEQNIKRQRTAKSPNSAPQPSSPPRSAAPSAQAISPTAAEDIDQAVRTVANPPVNAAPQRPVSRGQERPAGRSMPAPSPRIRPVTKPPAADPPPRMDPPVATAVSANVANSPIAASSVAKPNPAIQPQSGHAPAVPPPSVPRPEIPASAAVPPVMTAAATAAPSPAIAPAGTPTEPKAEPKVEPQQVALEEVEKPAASISDNQLADFEDNLAMNLGETLVPEDEPGQDGSLASEMDALLSEITSSPKDRA